MSGFQICAIALPYGLGAMQINRINIEIQRRYITGIVIYEF